MFNMSHQMCFYCLFLNSISSIHGNTFKPELKIKQKFKINKTKMQKALIAQMQLVLQQKEK